MGQAYIIINESKRQYIHPHRFGDGYKLTEFGASGGGTMFALAALLARGNGSNGGDLRSSDPLIGSWAGDPIVVLGEYTCQYEDATKTYEDISDRIRGVLVDAGEDVSQPL